jgi:hypothetical protein
MKKTESRKSRDTVALSLHFFKSTQKDGSFDTLMNSVVKNVIPFNIT